MPHQCLNCGEAFAEGSADLLDGCPSCEGTRFFYTEEPVDEEEREELQQETEDDVESMLRDIVEGDEKPDLGEDIWSRQAWEDWIRLKTSEEDVDLDEAVEGANVSFEELAEAADPDTKFEPTGTVSEPEEIAQADDSDAETVDPSETPEDDEEADPIQVELSDVEETPPPEQDEAQPSAEEQAVAAGGLEPAPNPDDDGRPSTLNINDPGEYEIDVRRLLEDSPVIVERDGSYVIHLPSVFEREE